MNELVSIITVSLNGVKTIEQTIVSVLSQDYSRIEYIVVDGGSTDGTLDIVRRYAESDARMRYVSEPDGGIYDAMNKGIRMASGDVIGLINSDDYCEPHAIKQVVEHIPEASKYVVYGMVRQIMNEHERHVLLINSYFLPMQMMCHQGCFVSKGVYEEYLYDTSYTVAADYDLFLKLYNDDEVCFVPVYAILVNFRLGGVSSGTLGRIEACKIRYKYGYVSATWYYAKRIELAVKGIAKRLVGSG